MVTTFKQQLCFLIQEKEQRASCGSRCSAKSNDFL
jgi:hypothetical protein